MKTQIIALETHDDLISVRDRMTWAKTPRILLIWPRYEKVTLRLLDLKVLQRHADSLGAQLGLVTRRANVRRDAESLGIPVFRSTADAQKDLWPETAPRNRRMPRPPRRDLRALRDSSIPKEAAWRSSLAARAIAFSIGIIAFLTVASLFVPRAAVVLYPEEKIQSVVIPISASESNSSVSLTGSLPAYPLTAIASAEQSAAVGSEVSIPQSKAKGVARFTNLSQADVEIPAGSIVISATGGRYATLHDTRAPVKGFVDAPIEATVAGAQGNAEANSIRAVEGALGLSVAVTNPEPISGGSDLTTTGPTDADRARLRSVILDNLRRDAEAKLRAQLSSEDILLMDTFEVSKILTETYSPEAGRAGKLLTLKMEAEFSARYVSAKDLKVLILASLDSSLPADFYTIVLPGFATVHEPVTDENGATRFDLKVNRTALRKIEFAQVFGLIRGQKPEAALKNLSANLSLRRPPEITLSPSWWPILPLIPFNVTLDVK